MLVFLDCWEKGHCSWFFETWGRGTQRGCLLICPSGVRVPASCWSKVVWACTPLSTFSQRLPLTKVPFEFILTNYLIVQYFKVGSKYCLFFFFIAFFLMATWSPPSPLPQNLFSLLLPSPPLHHLCQPLHQIILPTLPRCPLPRPPLSHPSLQHHHLPWPPWSLSMMLPISGEADLYYS